MSFFPVRSTRTNVSRMEGTVREAERSTLSRMLYHFGIGATLIAVGLILGGEIGCAPKIVTVNTNSPQTQVAQITKTVADADLVAVKTVISLRDSGKLSQLNTTLIENWLGFVATTDKSIGLILAKSEPWDAQKKEIYTLLATVTAPSIVTTIDPGAQTVITQILTLVSQLKVLTVP